MVGPIFRLPLVISERIVHDRAPGIRVIEEPPMKMKIQMEQDLLNSHYGGDACPDRNRGYDRRLDKLNKS